jgi:hypothetical protein
MKKRAGQSRDVIEAEVAIEEWWQYYNIVRPHSSVNYATSEAFSRIKGEVSINLRYPNLN